MRRPPAVPYGAVASRSRWQTDSPRFFKQSLMHSESDAELLTPVLPRVPDAVAEV